MAVKIQTLLSGKPFHEMAYHKYAWSGPHENNPVDTRWLVVQSLAAGIQDGLGHAHAGHLGNLHRTTWDENLDGVAGFQGFAGEIIPA